MMNLSMGMSAFLLLLSIVGFVLLTIADRRSRQDRFRVYTALLGVMGMVFLFYFLSHLVLRTGIWG